MKINIKLIVLLLGVFFVSCDTISEYPAVIIKTGSEGSSYYYGIKNGESSARTIYTLTDSLRYKVGDTIK